MKKMFMMFVTLVFSLSMIFGCGSENGVEETIEPETDADEVTYTDVRVSDEQERQILGQLVVRELASLDEPGTETNWIEMGEFILHLNGIVGHNKFDEELIREFAPRANRFNHVWIGTKDRNLKTPVGGLDAWEKLNKDDTIIIF